MASLHDPMREHRPDRAKERTDEKKQVKLSIKD